MRKPYKMIDAKNPVSTNEDNKLRLYSARTSLL